MLALKHVFYAANCCWNWTGRRSPLHQESKIMLINFHAEIERTRVMFSRVFVATRSMGVGVSGWLIRTGCLIGNEKCALGGMEVFWARQSMQDEHHGV